MADSPGAHLGLTETRYISRIVVEPENPQSIWVAAMGELYVTNPGRGIYHSATADPRGIRSCSLMTPPVLLTSSLIRTIRKLFTRPCGSVFEIWNGGMLGLRQWHFFAAPTVVSSWRASRTDCLLKAKGVGRIGLSNLESSPNVLYAIYADHPGYFAASTERRMAVTPGAAPMTATSRTFTAVLAGILEMSASDPTIPT